MHANDVDQPVWWISQIPNRNHFHVVFYGDVTDWTMDRRVEIVKQLSGFPCISDNGDVTQRYFFDEFGRHQIERSCYGGVDIGASLSDSPKARVPGSYNNKDDACDWYTELWLNPDYQLGLDAIRPSFREPAQKCGQIASCEVVATYPLPSLVDSIPADSPSAVIPPDVFKLPSRSSLFSIYDSSTAERENIKQLQEDNTEKVVVNQGQSVLKEKTDKRVYDALRKRLLKVFSAKDRKLANGLSRYLAPRTSGLTAGSERISQQFLADELKTKNTRQAAWILRSLVEQKILVIVAEYVRTMEARTYQWHPDVAETFGIMTHQFAEVDDSGHYPPNSSWDGSIKDLIACIQRKKTEDEIVDFIMKRLGGANRRSIEDIKSRYKNLRDKIKCGRFIIGATFLPKPAIDPWNQPAELSEVKPVVKSDIPRAGSVQPIAELQVVSTDEKTTEKRSSITYRVEMLRAEFPKRKFSLNAIDLYNDGQIYVFVSPREHGSSHDYDIDEIRRIILSCEPGARVYFLGKFLCDDSGSFPDREALKMIVKDYIKPNSITKAQPKSEKPVATVFIPTLGDPEEVEGDASLTEYFLKGQFHKGFRLRCDDAAISLIDATLGKMALFALCDQIEEIKRPIDKQGGVIWVRYFKLIGAEDFCHLSFCDESIATIKVKEDGWRLAYDSYFYDNAPQDFFFGRQQLTEYVSKVAMEQFPNIQRVACDGGVIEFIRTVTVRAVV